MARATTLCHICGASFGSPGERETHRDTAHPGYRTEWRGPRGRNLVIVAPDGSERAVTIADLRRMRKAANASGPSGAGAVPEPPPAPDDPDAEPTPEIAIRQAPGPRPRFTQPPGPIRPDRTSIAEALPSSTLAAVIRQISETLSDIDGAGPAGILSATEAAQIAQLLHDPTIDLVLRYFGGSVDRFKVALAVGLILLGKGRIHLAAIGRRQRSNARARAEARAVAAAAEPDTAIEVPAETDNPFAELARRQAAGASA